MQSHTSNYLLRPLLKQIDVDKHKCILDVGCGNGWLVNFLVEKGYNAFGLDASKEGVEIAKRSHPDRFFLQDITSDALPEPLTVKEFDLIIATEVIEHLYDPAGFLHFICDILTKNPKGPQECILTTPYHGYLKYLMLAILGKMDQHLNVEWIGGHIKFFSRRSLTRLLKNNHFEVLNFQGCGRVPYLWKSMLVKAKVSGDIGK